MSVISNIAELVKSFVKLASEVQTRRFAMGDLICQMLEKTDGSYAPVIRALKAEIPDAKLMLGYAITPPNLKAMAAMAATFRADDGLISPDGKHVVSREDIEALGLSVPEAGRMAELVSEGKIRLKTVAAASRAAKAGGKRAAKAISDLQILIAHDGERPTTAIGLADLRALLEKREKQAEKIQKEMTDLRIAIQAREEAQAATVAEANDDSDEQAEPTTAAPPVRESSRPRARRSTKKGADATVSAQP